MEELNVAELKTTAQLQVRDLQFATVTQSDVDKVLLFIRINQVKAKQCGIAGMAALTKAIVAKRVLVMLGLWEDKK